MKETSVIEWLNYYFERKDIDENQLKPILHFSLLWNLFENTYFTDKEHLSPQKLLELSEISEEKLDDDKLNLTFIFFKQRYVNKNQINDRFSLLQIHRQNIDFCKKILLDDNPTKVEKVKFLFLVIHRFRNNLFHGRKNPRTLNIYEDAFKQINKYLMFFIEETSENNNINRHRFIKTLL